MSPLQNASRRSPSSSEATTTKGLHENPHRMKYSIRHLGWSSPVGEGSFERVEFNTRTEKGIVTWERWSTSGLFLGHTSSLLLLQGMSIQNLFTSTFFENEKDTVAGPFYYLRGNMGELWRVPLRISKVVFGRVIDSPLLTTAELMSALVKVALIS